MGAICVRDHKNRPLACRCAAGTRVGSPAVSRYKHPRLRDKYVFLSFYCPQVIELKTCFIIIIMHLIGVLMYIHNMYLY